VEVVEQHLSIHTTCTCNVSGLKKKLLKVAKLKGCEIVKGWVQSITNNIYWIASSTPDGDKDLMLAKFDSVVDHIMDVHSHSNALFPRCMHGHLEHREWITPGKISKF
jgi:solute carrier family 8 (sodium/calcium exchanger)